LIDALDGSRTNERGDTAIRLNLSQREALLTAATSRASIIAGPAGTGKTTAIAYLVDMARESGKNVKLAALAGKAAKRLAEVVGAQATTIHRLLEFHPGMGFRRRRSNPIDADLVVIDEASMVDVALCESLLDAIDFRRTAVVFLGDPFQLPPVGPGAPFRDMIDFDLVRVARLEQVERHAGPLLRSATAILAGRVEPSSACDPGVIPAWANVGVLDDPADVIEMVRRLFMERLPEFPQFDAVWDVQVLSPQKKGRIGTEALNQLIQEIIQNQNGNEVFVDATAAERARSKYFVGDKVIQTKNNYDTGIMNGEVGIVTASDAEQVSIRFDAEVEVTVKRGDEEFDDIDLAYALTVHKSQGSQYPLVIVIAHTDHYVMLTRELLYTAATRAERHLILLGNGRGAWRAAKKPTPRRRTLLGQTGTLHRREGGRIQTHQKAVGAGSLAFSIEDEV
jgi:exodeoxyribonuclease V alpha subunit